MGKLLDFDVVIDSHGDGYRTRVVASPAGEAQADFVLPFTDQDLTILVLKVVGSIGRARRRVRRIQSEERRLLEDFGGQLFQAVFPGPVRDCLGRSRMEAESRDTGLRIRLRLPGALANIPWEYLYDAEYGFLSLSPETALVRYVEMATLVRPFPISPPLRILAMISAPSDVPGLQGEEEWGKLTDALDVLIDSGLVQVDRLEAGTLAALQRPLRLRDYHVLHFIGHGGYDEDAQDGALALEGADRTTRLVTGGDLGLMIRGHRSLRLVVLNACEGARSARDDPFGGVAQALVRQGIPAVIAMQFEISDPAALVFSQSFYQAIADGLPVDVATVEARRAMFAEGNDVEWATPVLYLRSPDGQVFTRDQIPQAEPEARVEADRKARDEAEDAVDLGDLLKEQGDVAGARAAYQKEIDAGHAEWAPAAAGHDERESQSQFDVVTLPDRSAVEDADLPLMIEGRYSGDMGAAVRVILEDSYRQYYIQNPEVKFLSDGTWRATNILPGDGIMYVHFVALDDAGKRFFDQMVERRAFGAFREMPTNSQVLRSVGIYRRTQSITRAEPPEEAPLLRVAPDAGKRDPTRRHHPNASAGRCAFVSYSQRDERYRQKLDISLVQLRRDKSISVWHDRKILPGQEWDREIDKNLESADIVLLLVSPDFLASDYAYGREMSRALERHHSGSATVVPIILRPSDWQNSPLGSLQALPSKGRPVSSWPNRDQAWLDVVQGLRRLIWG